MRSANMFSKWEQKIVFCKNWYHFFTKIDISCFLYQRCGQRLLVLDLQSTRRRLRKDMGAETASSRTIQFIVKNMFRNEKYRPAGLLPPGPAGRSLRRDGVCDVVHGVCDVAQSVCGVAHGVSDVAHAVFAKRLSGGGLVNQWWGREPYPVYIFIYETYFLFWNAGYQSKGGRFHCKF